MAKILALIEAAGLDNIRLHAGDAVDLLRWLPDGSLAGVDLLYPDPWPKRRHWKRRFVQDDTRGDARPRAAARRMFRFATDIPDYVGLDARAPAALAAIRLDRRARRRLAPALAGLSAAPATRPRRSARAACPAIWCFVAFREPRALAAAVWD